MPQPLAVFVTGDHEYSGEVTMPFLAAELADHCALATTVLKSAPDRYGEEDIPGLEALDEADLAVFYLRWRRLPPEQIEPLERYLQSGKPVMGFGTTSHGFRYPEGDPLESWNGWAAPAFGAPPGWGVDGHTHYGHESPTVVSIIEEATVTRSSAE